MKPTILLVERLYSCGLRPTPQRVAVYTYLCAPENKSAHPSVETVYNALLAEYPTLSRTTVYQTLETLCACGLVSKLVIDEGEMRFEAEMSKHGHFKCTVCGKIYDFTYPETMDFPPPPEGFVIKKTFLYYKGTCRKCSLTAVPS